MFDKKHILSRRKIKAYNAHRNYDNRGLPICLATHKSLRFMPEGNMTVCCHNNDFVLGRYPEKTPMEAWNADKKLFLREKLSKADFSAGCQACYYAFDKKAFDSVNPLLYENYEINSKYPVILDFKIATECNLRCIMCSEYSSSSIRNACNIPSDNSVYDDVFIDLIREFIPYLKEARFSGGEPFMNEIYFKLWDLLIEINPDCKIFIQTNGTLLNDRIKQLLARGNFYLNVSIDALSPGLYAKIRQNASLEKTLENIEFFAEYSERNKRKFGITACAMQDNISEWDGLVVFANQYNASIWFSEVYFPFVNALWLMSVDEIEAFLLKFKRVDFQIEKETDEYNVRVFNDLINKLQDYHVFKSKQSRHKKGVIRGSKLKTKLGILFKQSIDTNPLVWSNIENILDVDSECLFYDFTGQFINKYNADFAYKHFGLMSVDELEKNFAAIKIDA